MLGDVPTTSLHNDSIQWHDLCPFEAMHPVFVFYKPHASVANAFSLYTCYLLLSWGSTYYVLTLLWIKICSTALLGIVFHLSRRDQLYFYNNLGYSTVRLYAHAAVLDLLLWIGFVIITAQFI